MILYSLAKRSFYHYFNCHELFIYILSMKNITSLDKTDICFFNDFIEEGNNCWDI